MKFNKIELSINSNSSSLFSYCNVKYDVRKRTGDDKCLYTYLYIYLCRKIKWWETKLLKARALVKRHSVKFELMKSVNRRRRKHAREVLLTWMIWDENSRREKSKWERSIRKQTNNNSSSSRNFARMFGKNRLSSWSLSRDFCLVVLMTPTITSDQSKSMRKINKPYVDRWDVDLSDTYTSRRKTHSNQRWSTSHWQPVHLYQTIFRSVKRRCVHRTFFPPPLLLLLWSFVYSNINIAVLGLE